LHAAIEAVNKGECVVIYPEGTLTRDKNLWPMSAKNGVARIALTTGAPVIPAAQWGPQDVLGPYAKFPKFFPRKTMHVYAAAPLDLDDLRSQPMTATVLKEATDRIMHAITELLEEIRQEKAPAAPLNRDEALGTAKPEENS
jgi:1-acyl-sn-glycerol-3-phosphate acyltransferase